MSNYSNYENATSFYEFAQVSNFVSGDFLFYSVPVVLFVVVFFISIPYGRAKALTFAAFVANLATLMFNIQGLELPYWMLIGGGILFTVGIFLMFAEKER